VWRRGIDQQAIARPDSLKGERKKGRIMPSKSSLGCTAVLPHRRKVLNRKEESGGHARGLSARVKGGGNTLLFLRGECSLTSQKE